jgi:hypothetical protein
VIPVVQTKVASFAVPPDERGNCIQAAVASLFEVELESVPNFITARDWFAALNEWLLPTGLAAIIMPIEDMWVPSDVMYLLIGNSPRGDWTHIVIHKNGRLVHDPHPDGVGIAEGPRWIVMFVAKDPAWSSP